MRAACLCLFVLACLPFHALPQSGGTHGQIAGVWRGHSVCTVKNSPCHDEVNVYRISPIAERPGEFLVSADKIVDGQEQEMGSANWNYDEPSHTLSYRFAKGTFRLTLHGEKLDGDLKLPDGTLYRQIYLQRDK